MTDNIQDIIGTSEAGSIVSPQENPSPPVLFPQQTYSTLLPEQKQASFAESFEAAANTEIGRSVYATKEFYEDNLQKPDPYYNPLKDPILLAKGNEHVNKYIDEFKDSPNSEVTAQRMQKIDEYQRNYDIASKNGLGAITGFIVGSILDPTTGLMFTGLGSAAKASTWSRMATAFGGAFVSTIASEAAAQKTNPFRTMEESMNNVIFTGVLAGVGLTLANLKGVNIKSLGKAIQGEEGFFNADFSKADKAMAKRLLSGLDEDKSILQATYDLTPLAKMTDEEINLANSKFADTNVAAKISGKLGATWSSALRFGTANLPYTNELGARMWGNSYYTKGNLKGIARPSNIEHVSLAAEMSRTQPFYKKLDNAYEIYKKAEVQGKRLSREEFETQALKNRRNGVKSDVPGMQSAQDSINSFYSDYFKYLKGKGKLTKDYEIPEGSMAYTTMMPDKELIALNYSAAKEAWKNAMIKVEKDANAAEWAKYNTQDSATSTALPPVYLDSAKLAELENKVSAQADNVLNEYLTQKGTKLLSNASFDSPYLKKRLPIPDYMVEDFLVSDPRRLVSIYSRSMEREIAIKDVLGFDSGDDILTSIRAQYTKAINEATDIKVKQKLLDEQHNIEIDAKNRLNQFLGQDESYLEKNTMSSKVITGTITAGNLSVLGLTAISQPPEIMKKFFTISMMNKAKVLQDGLEEAKLIMNKDDAALIAVGIDTRTNRDLAAYTDVIDEANAVSKFDRINSKINGGFNWLTGMSKINDYMGLSFLEGMAQDTIGMISRSLKEDLRIGAIGRRIERLDASDANIEIELARLGFDKRLQKAVIREVKEHAVEKEGIYILNIGEWTNNDVKVNFLAKMRNELDAGRVIPSYAAKPYVLNKGFGRIVGHLKGWMFGSYAQSFVPSMQAIAGISGQHTAMSLGRMATMTAMGSLVYVAKQIAAGKEKDKIDMSAKRLLMEGFNRGGAFAVLDYTGSILDRVGVGPASILGTQTSTRFLDQSLMDQLLGPTGGLINDSYNFVGKVGRGAATDRDYARMIRHAPGFNWIGWNWMTNEIINTETKK